MAKHNIRDCGICCELSLVLRMFIMTDVEFIINGCLLTDVDEMQNCSCCGTYACCPLTPQGAVPEALRGRRIFSLDLLSLTAGSSMRGEFEKRMKDLISFFQKNADEVIVFIDEIHTLIGAGKAAGSMDASQILKVPLARGEIVYAP